MKIGAGLGLFLVVGLVFGVLAGMMAFLITYEEYSHHQFDRATLIRRSLETAVVAFVVILVLALAIGFFVNLGG